MKFEEAARMQYLHSSYYVVFLVGPAGERERLGLSQRKSGTGLISLLRRDRVQELVKAKFPDADQLEFKKRKDRLEISNGWRIEFGGTVRQESE